jgi:membrane-associated phospholipid phosphatase
MHESHADYSAEFQGMTMHLPSLRVWLIALVAVAAVIVFCVWIVDLPVALYVHAHAGGLNFLARPLDAEVLFVPLAALTIFACGCAVLAGRATPRWADIMMVASFSLLGAIACNFFLLQPAFGRLDLGWWLVKGRYGFDFLHGQEGQGFPSGHATLAASFLSVFWLYYPRARIFIAAFIAVESAGLVLLNWHFVSDVIGGLFVGATAAIMTTALFRKGISAG